MNSNIVLSILILSIERRKTLLARLLDVLSNQIDDSLIHQIEILTFVDNEETPIGIKRNYLIDKAKGKYLVFIDDDDIVSDKYIPEILDAVKSDPDCIGFKGTLYINNIKWQLNHSLHNKGRHLDHRTLTAYNTIRHINPIKSCIAKQFTFSNKYWGEDDDYMSSILKSDLIKSEKFIDNLMYHYIPSNEDSLKQQKDRQLNEVFNKISNT